MGQTLPGMTSSFVHVPIMIDVLDGFSSKYKMVFLTYSISGERFQTYNCHSLLHLADDVKQRGPLWTHSCFPFEDYNGDLKDIFHGTQNIPNVCSVVWTLIDNGNQITRLLAIGVKIQLSFLWTHSCFPFEDYNGDLKDLFHGTQIIPGQVIFLKMLYHVALRTQMVEQRINSEVCSVA